MSRGTMPWATARTAAARAVEPLTPRAVPLEQAAGAVLGADAVALTDLPAADTAAMDGWAVAGPPPWRVVGQVLAGAVPARLDAGTAVRIATGAVVPAGADGVLRREHGVTAGAPSPGADGELRPARPGALAAVPADVRRAGGECRRGEVVLGAGSRLTPAAMGLLAAAGHDAVAVRRARAQVLVLGDELLTDGVARDGRVRDALGPLLGAWLPAVGVEVAGLCHVPDGPGELRAAIGAPDADLVVTTGSTARGPVDHLHAVLADVGARLVVDGVAVRPGHPQLLALLPDGRPLVGLPGNPLAAVSALLTLLDPVVAALHGRPERPGLPGEPHLEVRLAEPVAAGDEATRLVPVVAGRPVLFAGPAMLRGLAAAEGVAVVPPGGLAAGARARLLLLPGTR